MKTIVTIMQSQAKNDLSQVESEFGHLLKIVAGCTSVLEIGSLFGGSAKRIAESMPEGSRMVCVDFGYEALKSEWKTLPALLWRLESIQNRDVTLILGDSKSEKVIEEVRKLAPFDLVFIDASHDYQSVVTDWNNYSKMAKIVAFHDIASCAGVKQLWKELRKVYPRQDHFIDGDAAGIGVLWLS